MRLTTGPGRPLLVVLEDIHWCDDTSLDWLLYFARQLDTSPLLLVMTYRPDAAHPTLNHLLANLDRIPGVSEIRLSPLTRSDVDAMLRAIFELTSSPRAEFLDALFELTEGNPFFIEEVLKSLLAAGDIYQIGGEWTRKPLRELAIPRSIQVAVQERTARLAPPAQHILTLAAVMGQRFDFSLLRTITRQSEDELLTHLKALMASQLVVEESEERFAFRHALTAWRGSLRPRRVPTGGDGAGTGRTAGGAAY
jgi:predicted ATPase